MSTTEIIPSLSFETLLARRRAAVEQLETIAGAVRAYAELGGTIFGAEANDTGPRWLAAPYTYREPLDLRPSGRGEYLSDPEKWLTASVAAVDAALWDHLLDLSGMRSFLDKAARDEWRKQIEERKTPPLTPENVRATFEGIHAQRTTFFERGVVAVFRSLSWNYKTNRPEAFGKRIIIRYLWSGYGPNDRTCDSLDDLERVMTVLDGKPEPDHRQGWSQKLWNAKHQRRGGDRWTGQIATEYLRVKVFGNGNGHVEFLNLALVDELNRILAKHFPDAIPRSREPVPAPGTAPLARVEGA